VVQTLFEHVKTQKRDSVVDAAEVVDGVVAAAPGGVVGRV